MSEKVKKLRPLKCGACAKFDDRELMTQNDKGKYFHVGECYDKHIRDVEFKKREFDKKTSLVIKIADIHGLENYEYIPSSFYPSIEDVRNDSKLFGKLKKNYKNGLPYEAIEYTYEFCREKIVWAKQNKEFKNVLSELRYGLAIVRNNIADAKNHSSKQNKQKQQSEQVIKSAEAATIINEKIKNVQNTNIKKKKEAGLDLSSLFD